MEWRSEAEQGLPPQRHQEPQALRQDILDELADHLALAAQRECDAGAKDEKDMRARVIRNFGNPAAIARALWWDAMKETIVKDWIQITLNAVLCIVVIGFMLLFYRQMQTSNTALLNALGDRSEIAPDRLPSVEFIVHRGSRDGAIVEGLEITLVGKPFNEDTTSIVETTDNQGRAVFGPIRAGIYRILMTDTQTEMMSDGRQVTLYSGDELKSLHIVAPPIDAPPFALDTSSPFPDEITEVDFAVMVSYQEEWVLEEGVWRSSIERNALIAMHDGLYKIEKANDDSTYFKIGERVTHVDANRLEFHYFTLVKKVSNIVPPENAYTRWDTRNGKPLFSDDIVTSYDLNPDTRNNFKLTLPDGLLNAYTIEKRKIANSQHGIPVWRAWFPEYISEKYPDYIIDHAKLVSDSLLTYENNGRTIMNPSVEFFNPVDPQLNQIFSFDDAPKTLPKDAKLLLGVVIRNRNLFDLDLEYQVYLDFEQKDYNPTESTEVKPFTVVEVEPFTLGNPILTIKATELDDNAPGYLFLDFTDALRNVPNFQSATGVLFKWAAETKNVVLFNPPEEKSDSHNPVWIVLKPFSAIAKSDAP